MFAVLTNKNNLSFPKSLPLRTLYIGLKSSMRHKITLILLRSSTVFMQTSKGWKQN